MHVNDKLYKAPEIMDEMPGIGNSREISDEDIAEVMSFIRNAWNNRASEASTRDIRKIRRKIWKPAKSLYYGGIEEIEMRFFQ